MSRIVASFFSAYAALCAADDTYDYVVVGAGSAGSPLAAKLARAGKSVLLLEAGPDDDWKGHDVDGKPVNPLIPNNVMDTLYSPGMDDAVMSEPIWEIERNQRDERFCSLPETDCTDILEGRREFMPRARIVGGCSMHNWMIQLRPSPEIYEDWGERWKWETLFPKFKAMETNLQSGADMEYHGDSGECYATSPEIYPADVAFLKAAEKAGHKRNDDFNGKSRMGIGRWPKSIINGSRWGASQSFLTPEVRSLPNFKLITGAMATKVEFDGRRAAGLTYVKDGINATAKAAKEVILSAGAFRSPQLLMLSGIAPSSLFELHPELPHIAEREGVGRNLQDHLMAPIPVGVPLNASYLGNPRSDYDGSVIGGFFFSSWCKSRGCTYPDMQYMCGTSTDAQLPSMFVCSPGLVGHIQSAPGWLTLKSLDPNDYPAIVLNYLNAQADVDRLVEASLHFMNITKLDAAMFTDTGFLTENNAEEMVKTDATTIYHPIGTAKMGPASDPLAVVDQTLKVHGVDGLRVCDASVMPLITNVNTDLPTRMIGYHLADMILEEDNNLVSV